MGVAGRDNRNDACMLEMFCVLTVMLVLELAHVIKLQELNTHTGLHEKLVKPQTRRNVSTPAF